MNDHGDDGDDGNDITGNGISMDGTIDYSRATVIFMYLVPRGLRLMKDLLWPRMDRTTANTNSITMTNATGAGVVGEGEAMLYDGGIVDIDDVDDGHGDGRGRRVMANATMDGTMSMSKKTTESITSNAGSDNDRNYDNDDEGNDNNNDDDDDDDEGENDGVGTIAATTSTSNDSMVGNGVVRRRRRRRIITYMSPFVDIAFVRKEHCTVEHQEGSSWPLYLYHCPVDD
jgi:hypothetical protein